MASRVLVVDDDPAVRWLVRRHFEEQGTAVLEAESARSALDQLERGRFDLVITDIRMPGRSGLWLLERVRERWAHLPVIVITGGVPTGARPGWERQATAVVLKPLRLRELYARVERVLAARTGAGGGTAPESRRAVLRKGSSPMS